MNAKLVTQSSIMAANDGMNLNRSEEKGMLHVA